jgi:hypothetical protein
MARRPDDRSAQTALTRGVFPDIGTTNSYNVISITGRLRGKPQIGGLAVIGENFFFPS